ncbi:AsmA-like C-terminal region-containing protein [Variovorax sp. UMC13]|uniref:AsmA-like C-terminal region-containing protein n=1 Tax=Variovorax sp. UMC13 TaxID=1862326 RepID=UPI0016045763|nr:AsmA-like C-terminal region-containing protein [Variovorax sp. UMC13]MBB1604111.1 hypothetical protein [Variovorax sp. UMC13]
MKRSVLWLAGGATALAVAAGLLAWWVPSNAELAARAQAEFEQRTGIGLRIGGLHWSVLPTPRLVLEEVATMQDAPIRVRRLELRAPWRTLLERRIRIDWAEADGVALPRASVRAFRGQGDAVSPPGGGAWTLDPLPVAQVRFTDVTWIDRREIALAYDGEIDFDPHWRPRSAELRRAADASSPVRLRLEREGDADRWRTLIDVGGGTWNGQTALETAQDGSLLLTGQLEPRNVDIEQLMKSFGRSTPVAGKVNGRTELRATGADAGALWRSAHTRTRFTVQPATLTRFDLAKAIRSAGTSRGGRTPLDSLTGTLDTQATGDGTRLQYSDLKARSGVLTATGSARIFLRKLDGEVAVDIVDGVVGVPLKLGGTLDDPELSLTGGALTGAAVGTAVLPGVGTAIGARIGQQVERLFGGDKKKPATRGPRAP